jgi:UDP-N-acetylmuramoylalanine--D-glutamate ligase
LEHVKVLVLMGATAPRIEAALRALPEFEGSDLIIEHAKDMEEAVALARKNAQPGDIVTMSPASASFDLYPNFEVRGRHYKQIVRELQ